MPTGRNSYGAQSVVSSPTTQNGIGDVFAFGASMTRWNFPVG